VKKTNILNKISIVLLFLCALALISQGKFLYAQKAKTMNNIKINQLKSEVNIYIDSNNGNDLNSGNSPASPIKTLNRLKELKIKQNTTVSFKKGGQWHGSLPVVSSLSLYPVAYKSYGRGSIPVISGSVEINGWEIFGGNIFVASNVTQTVTDLFLDGTKQVSARFPNNGYLIIDENSQDIYDQGIEIVDNDLDQPDDYWNMSTVHIRTAPWRIEKRRVADYILSENKIILEQYTSWGYRKGFGYYLENKFEELDAPGEWFYDRQAAQLYFWPPDGVDIHSSTIEGVVEEHALYSSFANNVLIEGLRFKNYANSCIQIDNGSDITILNNEISHCGEHGVEIGTLDSSPQNIEISYNYIHDMDDSGIYLRKTNSASIIYNSIRENNNMGISYAAGSSNAVIRGNSIFDSGYTGIQLGGASASSNLVERNYIKNSCKLLDDCAGIYIGGGSTEYGWIQPAEIGINNQIIENIVIDSVGNTDGEPSQISKAQGIYIDDRSRDMVVLGNTVSRSDYGIQVHNAYSNLIRDNTIYGSRQSSIYISEDDIVGIPGYVQDNNITNNTFFTFSKFAEDASIKMEGFLGQTNFGSYENNYYAHQSDAWPVIRSTWVNGLSTLERFHLADWQDASGNDLNSIDFNDIINIAPWDSAVPIGDEMIPSGNFNANISGWARWPECRIWQQWVPSCGLDGGCLEATTSDDDCQPGVDTMNIIGISPNFSIEKGKDYYLQFSVKSDAPDNIEILVRRAGEMFESLGFSQPIFLDTTSQDFAFVFRVTQDVLNARLDFISQSAEVTYWIDNVSLKEANVSYNQPKNYSRIYYNASNSTQDVGLSIPFVDLYGNAVSDPLSIPSYGSQILIVGPSQAPPHIPRNWEVGFE